MDQSKKQKLITQILIGSAWIDRKLEPEESRVLQRILERYGLANDADLLSLLTMPPPVQTTEKWLVEYFKVSSEEERMQLLADIGRVLIADDTVSDIEHDLLDEYHELMARIPAQHVTHQDGPHPSVVEEIGKAVRHIGSFVVDMINQVNSKAS